MKFWLVFLIFYFFVFVSPALGAAEINLSGVPLEIEINQAFTVHLTYQSTSKNTKYYLRACFYLSGTTDYFGCIKNNQENWSCGSLDDKTAYYEIITDDNGNWEGDLVVKTEEGNGNQLKIRRYTAGGSSLDSNTVNLEIITLKTPEVSPALVSPDPSPSPAKAVCQINNVKDKEGNTLSSVKIYLDGEYLHHYAPENLYFCQDCQDGGFGSHMIGLEKNGWQNWEEEFDFQAGSSIQINAVLETESSSPSPSPTSEPKQSIQPSASAEVFAGIEAQEATESFWFDFASPLPVSPSAQVLGKSQEKKNNPAVLAGGVSLLGLLLTGFGFGQSIVKKFLKI